MEKRLNVGNSHPWVRTFVAWSFQNPRNKQASERKQSQPIRCHPTFSNLVVWQTTVEGTGPGELSHQEQTEWGAWEDIKMERARWACKQDDAKGHPLFFFYRKNGNKSSSRITDQSTDSGRLGWWVTESIWLTKEAWAQAPARHEDIWEKKQCRWPWLILSKSCETQWNTKGGKQKQSIQSLGVLLLNDFTVYMIIYTCRYNFLEIKPTWKIN